MHNEETKNKIVKPEISNKGGRPTNRKRKNKKISDTMNKLTEEAIIKLEQMASLGASKGETAYYLGVSEQTVRNWKKKNSKLFVELDRLAQKPILKARMTVVGALGQYTPAMEYLRKKRKSEFGDAEINVGELKINIINYSSKKKEK